MAGDTELANEKHVKGGAKLPGDFEGYRDAASGEPQDNHIRAASVFLQVTPKLSASIGTIVKPHNLTSSPLRTPRSAREGVLRSNLVAPRSCMGGGNLDTKLTAHA
jgi:hypothetical protein